MAKKKAAKYTKVELVIPRLYSSLRGIIHTGVATLKQDDESQPDCIVICACGQKLKDPPVYSNMFNWQPSISIAAMAVSKGWSVCEACARAKGDQYLSKARLWLERATYMVKQMAMEKCGLVEETFNKQWFYRITGQYQYSESYGIVLANNEDEAARHLAVEGGYARLGDRFDEELGWFKEVRLGLTLIEKRGVAPYAVEMHSWGSDE